MPRLTVCGDSFMSATSSQGSRSDVLDSEGRHFTEILAAKLGYEYRTFARGASSLALIALQVEQALREGGDFILVADTTPGRLEFPYRAARPRFNQKPISVYDFDYSAYPDLSARNPNFKSGQFISETLSNMLDHQGNLVENFYYDLTETKVSALKDYVLELYNEPLAQKKNSWISQAIVDSLRQSGRDWLFIFNAGSCSFSPVLDRDRDPRLIKQKELLPLNYVDRSPRRWHTTDQSQQLLAELYAGYIKDHNILTLHSQSNKG